MLVPVTEITAWYTTKHQSAWLLIRLDFDALTLALRKRRYYRLPELRAADGVTSAYVTYCAFSDDQLLYYGYTNVDRTDPGDPFTSQDHWGVVPLVPLEAPPVSFIESRRILLYQDTYEPSDVFYLDKNTAVLNLGERSDNTSVYLKVLDLPSMEFIAGIESTSSTELATALTPESWGTTADGGLVGVYRKSEAPGSVRAYQYEYDFRRLSLGQMRALDAWPAPAGSFVLHADNPFHVHGPHMAVKALHGDNFNWGEVPWASSYTLPAGLTAVRSKITGFYAATQYALQADGSVVADKVTPPMEPPAVDWAYELSLLPDLPGDPPISGVFGMGYDLRHSEAELFWTERVSTLEIA